MPSSIDKIVEGFPSRMIDPIVRAPNYKKIAKVHLKLNSNAASFHSNLGNGALSLLYLTLSPAVYSALSATNLFVPVNPGAAPVIPTGSIAPQNLVFAMRSRPPKIFSLSMTALINTYGSSYSRPSTKYVSTLCDTNTSATVTQPLMRC